MKHLSSEQLWTTLNELLAGRGDDVGADLPGAELAIFDEHDEAFRAALARHARRDEKDPAVIWVRPLVARWFSAESALPIFDLAIVRRRALHVTDARFGDGVLQFDLITGQRGRIEPARGNRLDLLQDFDTWMVTLTPDERAEIEALDF